MKQIFTLIGFLLLLLAIGLGVAYLLPVKATMGVLITLHLVVLSVLGAMTLPGEKPADKPNGNRRHKKTQEPKTED